MAKVSPILTNFTGGEWSERLQGRIDLEGYYNACRTLENMIVHPHGGASRRFGTCFVAETKDSSKTARLVPFIFSTEQAYILELGDQYMRVFKDNGQIVTGGGAAYEIATSYIESQLSTIKHAQSADTMYLVHPSVPTQKLTRTAHTTWIMDDVDWQDGPYEAEVSGVNLDPDGTTGNVTIVAAASVFAAADVGRLVRWQADDGNWYWFKITDYDYATQIKADVKGSDLPNHNASNPYRLGIWCGGSGYPSSVSFYEQRLVLAASDEYPQTIWGSKSNDDTASGISYEDFTPGTDDDDPYGYTIAADQVNVVRWLNAVRYLMVGTVGGEWIMSSGSDDVPITPSAVKVRREATYGSYNLQGLAIGRAILFLQRAGRKIRELAYRYELDNYVAPDLTLLAEHVTEGGIVDWAWQSEPDSILWCVRADGVLLGLTYDRDQGVVAWHRHITDGEVESVAVIPASDHDQLWMIVKRTIGGETKRYVEYMKPDFGTAVEDAFFVDCGLSYDDTATDTFSGLDHLEGETVSILADGAVCADTDVVSGAITLSDAASVVHVGLPYTSVLEPMRLEAGSQEGTAQGKIKRIHKLIVRFYRTIGARIGTDSENIDVVPFRKPSDLMGSGPALFTGDKEVEFPGGYSKDSFIRIEQTQPLPMTVLSIMPRMKTYDG